jgi:ubiquinone/menaquinone biosynthesis C-methylase UbiE
MHLTNGVTLSAAASAFDRIAGSYDELFTRTAVGRAQRKQVWGRLLAAFPLGNRILELNCGTGEDARFLARNGRSVVACDGSGEMIEVARRRDREEGGLPAVSYLRLHNEDLSSLPADWGFDGAFSNFSGLNCLEDLNPVATNLAYLVRPGGRVLICLWSRSCAAEMLWYLLRGQPKKALRRCSGKTTARLGGMTIAISYPTIRAVRRSFAPWFQLNSRRAVGLFVPPSYAEPSIRNHMSILARLEWMDSLCADWPILRDFGDHTLLEFERCNR